MALGSTQPLTEMSTRNISLHEERLHHHANIEAIQLLENVDIVRRLQRKKPFELI
jgi:hypothetical protein